MAEKNTHKAADGDGKQPSIHEKEMATHYGMALAFLRSDPELKKLFHQAVRETWPAERFVAMLQGTKWFKHHSSAVRNAIMQKTSDPASWQANVDKMQSEVEDSWGKLFGDASHKKGQLHHWAQLATRMGWSPAQLTDHMMQGVKLQSLLTQKSLGGTATETQDQIKSLASQYGVQVGDHWTQHRIRSVLDGSTTMGGVQAQIKNLAMQQYGAFADRIQAGETMQDIADPFVQRMSDLLELNPNQIKLSDHAIQNALTQKDPKTGKVAPMNLADFSDAIRKDPRWQYTDNAKKTTADTTASLLQSWGLVA